MHDGNKMTEVGLIPEDWNAYNLGDLIIGKPMYGANVAAVDFDIELPRYVRITDIKDDGRLHQTEIKSYPVSEELDYRLNVDDICFARSGATVGKTYLYDPCDGECIFAGYLIKFVPDRNKLIPKYLFHFTHSQHYYNWVKGNLRQGAQPNINAQEYSSLVLPLPPLSEQQKIADILTTVDDHISETEALIEKAKVLKQGLMQQLLTKGIGHTEFKDTEIGRIPVGWEVNRLEDITKLMGGFAFKSKEFCENGIIVIKINNITDEGFNYDNKTYYPLDKIDEYRSFIPDVDDILMTMTGNIGRVAYVKSENLPCLVNQRVGRVKVKNIAQTNPLYLYHYFNTPFYRQLLADMSAGGAQQNISTAQINSTLIPIPPLPEQRQIAAILTSVDDQIDTYQAKLASLTRLKTGLMQQLLTGKIRVKV